MKSDKKTLKEELLVYAVTDRHWLNGETLYGQVEKALKGGATFIQLREKNLDEKAFLQEAIEIGTLCREYDVPFVIDDNVKIAVQAGADGVHVGQSDMEAGDVRRKLGPDKIIGVSTHSVAEAQAALAAGADYLGVGAAFVTGTKTDAKPVGHDVIRAVTAAVDIPVVAIGGIGRDNILELSGCGLAGVAVVSALFARKDVAAAARELHDLAEQIAR